MIDEASIIGFCFKKRMQGFLKGSSIPEIVCLACARRINIGPQEAVLLLTGRQLDEDEILLRSISEGSFYNCNRCKTKF
jgi:hypothetical protein